MAWSRSSRSSRGTRCSRTRRWSGRNAPRSRHSSPRCWRTQVCNTPGSEKPWEVGRLLSMVFDLSELLAARHGEGYALAGQHLNPQLPRMLHAIGFDRVYERAEGAYLYDSEGQAY